MSDQSCIRDSGHPSWVRMEELACKITLEITLGKVRLRGSFPTMHLAFDLQVARNLDQADRLFSRLCKKHGLTWHRTVRACVSGKRGRLGVRSYLYAKKGQRAAVLTVMNLRSGGYGVIAGDEDDFKRYQTARDLGYSRGISLAVRDKAISDLIGCGWDPAEAEKVVVRG